MPGLNLRGIRVNATPALVEKHIVHLGSASVSADPIPATNIYSLRGDRKYTPGHSAPDPKPTMSASSCYAGDWRSASEETVVDPIPARSF
jgi:hypothetical protein